MTIGRLPYIALRGILLGLSVALCCSAAEMPDSSTANAGNLLARSGDAYIRQTGASWTFGTARVEQEVALQGGHFRLIKFINKMTHHDYLEGPSYEFRFGVDGQTVTGGSTSWTLDGAAEEILTQGALCLRITLHNGSLQVEKNYLIYPQESIIQEWLRIRNISDHAVTLTDPFFLQKRLMQNEAPQLDFSYMTGGMCFYGSWILKTCSLTPTYARHFDASDPAECLPGKPCPKGWLLGNSIYAPIYVFFNREKKDGIFVGWDYLGRWGSYIGNYNGGPVNIGLKVSGYKKTLYPESDVTTPRAFTGVFTGDLDNMGNQLLDYQYRYKWDYTRPQYFPAIRMLGYWWKGATNWPPGSPEPVDFTSTFRKIFRTADLIRYAGADVYWRDYGWWDIGGDWNGPDFQEAGRYLGKYGMRQTIYLIAYDAEQGSKVVDQHPDWLVPKGGDFGGQYYLNQATPGVTDFELSLLNRRILQWGNFEWRIDDSPLHAVKGDETPLLAQAQNFQRLVKQFLDQNPGAAFHGCNDGGNGLGYEMLRLASIWQFTDGCVGRYKDYYASYLFPPDKLENQPDNWDPDHYEKSTWRGLLWSSFPMTGDTFNPKKLEGIRQLIDIYHYLVKKGVAGRWVKIYHPNVKGDSPECYLERMSRDNLRGIIIPAHSPDFPATIYHGNGQYSLGKRTSPPVVGPITIYPKGLLPATTYNVSFQESKVMASRLGSDLMEHGITFSHMPDGELIYLNLPMHPGSTADSVPPTSPGQVTKTFGTNMGVIGVELHWIPATDNNWISYYVIFRNGEPIDKVAKGTYYFDHSAGADLDARYEVEAVDGSGNTSAKVMAQGDDGQNVEVIDDANQEVHYSGSGWKHERNVWGVYQQTQSASSHSGDSAEFNFSGNRITWFGGLGAALGRADVYIDGILDRTVDCYDADEIPNMPVYSRAFSASGHHKLRIVVRGDRNPNSKGNAVFIDGFQVGRRHSQVVEDRVTDGIQYSGSGWVHSLGWKHASQGSVSWSGIPGDAAEYTFRGDGIMWVGKLCPSCGMADVYIDGELDSIVNTYEPDQHAHRWLNQGGWQAPIYEKSWPEFGEHKIRIVVREDKDISSTGHNVFIDSLQISSSD